MGCVRVLTDFGVTITGSCSTNCLAQFRRDAAVPADASQAGPRRRVAERFGGAGVVALEVRVAERVHEVAGRFAAGGSRAEGGRVVHVTVDGLLAPW
jgi:hypothetical protein